MMSAAAEKIHERKVGGHTILSNHGKGFCAKWNSSQGLSSMNDLKSGFDLGEILNNEDMKLESSKSMNCDLGKIYGFEDIYRELKNMGTPGEAYHDFHFQLGVACREMGFVDEAIEEFKISLERKEKSFESANQLSSCYRDKGWYDEAAKAFQEALSFEKEGKAKLQSKMYEMDLFEVT